MTVRSRRAIAIVEFIALFPAVLFMSSLFMRNVQPQVYEPAHSAQRIVSWYASSPHIGLSILLVTLPLAALITGCITIYREWQHDEALRRAAHALAQITRNHLATLITALATITAAAVLGIVALHVITD